MSFLRRRKGPARSAPGCSPRQQARPPASPPRSWTTSRPRHCPATSSASWRSEEHTSELQSRQYLVCRLLLEKKKDAGRVARTVTNIVADGSRYADDKRLR